ncbi:unnamed protein product, partial [marine sediment metagenome]
YLHIIKEVKQSKVKNKRNYLTKKTYETIIPNLFRKLKYTVVCTFLI